MLNNKEYAANLFIKTVSLYDAGVRESVTLLKIGTLIIIIPVLRFMEGRG